MRQITRRVSSKTLALGFIAFMLLARVKAGAEPRFTLTPSLSISEIYDDNLFPSSGGSDWDLYTIIKPEFDSKLSLRFTELSFGYSPTFMLFPKHFKNPGVKEILHDAHFNAQTVFTSGLTLTLTEKFYTLPVSYTEASFTPSNAAQSNELSFSAGYGFDISPTLEADSRAQFSRFDVSVSDTDGMFLNWEASLTKSFNSILRLGIVNSLMKYWYDDLSSDPFVLGIGLRPEYEITPNFVGSVTFGYRYLVLEGLDNESSFRYRVELGYNTSAGNVATLYLSQDFMVDLLGNSFDSTTVGLSLNKRILPGVSVVSDLAFSILKDKALQAGTDDTKILSFNPGFEIELNRDFLLSLGYNGFYNKWGNAGANFTNNRVYITINYSRKR